MRTLKIALCVAALTWSTVAIAGKTTITHRDGSKTHIYSSQMNGSTITHTDKRGRTTGHSSSSASGRAGHRSMIRSYRKSGSRVRTRWD